MPMIFFNYLQFLPLQENQFEHFSVNPFCIFLSLYTPVCECMCFPYLKKWGNMGIDTHTFKLNACVCVCLYQNIEKYPKVSLMHNSLGGSYAFLQLISLWKDEVHTTFLRLLCGSDSRCE